MVLFTYYSNPDYVYFHPPIMIAYITVLSFSCCSIVRNYGSEIQKNSACLLQKPISFYFHSPHGNQFYSISVAPPRYSNFKMILLRYSNSKYFIYPLKQ